MFSIELTDEAKKDLKKLEKKEAEIILKKIYSIRSNPLHFIERLSGVPLWKLRAGDYRAILQVVTKDSMIRIIKIGHRGNIYKSLKQ